MNINKKRHIILQFIFEKIDKSGNGISREEVSQFVGKDKDRIGWLALMDEMSTNKYLLWNKGKCYMTTKGINAYLSKEYLNKVWYRQFSNWVSILSLIFSAIALIISSLR